jgi:ribosomal protein S18 acetylase RimI-like enzyme
MNIQNSTIEDVDAIFELYKTASDYQKKKSVVTWPDFESALVLAEINEKRQWKLLIDKKIACVWATTDSDPQIWQKRNEDPAIYIHRISTNSEFRGQHLVEEIVKWSKIHAIETGKKYIRMDTVGENMGLINHYTKCGFEFLGLSKLSNTINLPAHYQNATVSLFQITV